MKENSKTKYAIRADLKTDNMVFMHNQIMSFPKMYVDHKNGNGLDNRRINLRLATRRQNSQNSRKRGNTSSKFKGVSFHKQSGKWRSRIIINGTECFLGLFDSEESAAQMYRSVALEVFGEFANFKSLDEV